MAVGNPFADMNNVYIKLVLPTIFSILLFILTIFLILIPRYKQNIMNGKREMIRELTNSALSILSKYENDENEGILTRGEAQETAISRIQYLRYGEENKDYFWITDTTPRMIMHPFRNDLNGKDLTNFTDPHGKRFFVEFVETVRYADQGYVNYMWQWKDDSLRIVPKLSYVSIFKPWNWIIGTGIYIEDVQTEISSLTKSMIWLSIFILVLISALLFYIIKESFGLERKRALAENELHKTRDKYRTLVEAATEGLIMLTDGKISFANNIISKWTGYGNSELLNISLNEIIARNNCQSILDIFSGTSIREGRFELVLKRKSGGHIETIVTSSKTLLYDKPVTIITVKDISADKNLHLTNVDYQRLMSIQDLGYFKARMDKKGKILFANEKTIRILGFENFEELSKTPVLKLVAESDDRRYLKKIFEEKGSLKNKILKIIKKNGDLAYVSISLEVSDNEKDDNLICDGIIEDITLAEADKNRTIELIASLRTNGFMIEQPVKDFVTQVNMIDAEMTLNEMLHRMAVNKTDCLLLNRNGNKPIGIITNSDIQHRILSLNLNLDNPAYLIMSSPVKNITENAPVSDALRIFNEHKINHLLVRNEADEITGILRNQDICKALTSSLSFLINNVSRSESNIEIKQCYSDLKRLIIPLIKSELAVKYITNINTAFSDAAIKRIIELTLAESGKPPADFAFICLGSEGRKEETLFTDQDNAIIYEDVPKEKENSVNEYFLQFGTRICTSLDYVGYTFCKGSIMAKNLRWCKPFKVWEKYFTDWIKTPEPQNLLDASVFFDFRTVYGNEEFAERLSSKIFAVIKDNPLFLYHLAHNTFTAKAQHISSGSFLDRNTEVLDLKNAVVPVIMFARTYSLGNNIRPSNTIERLTALGEKNIFSKTIIDELIYIFNFLMKLRFRNQADQLNRSVILSNLLDTVNLTEPELHLLKKVLMSIPDFQARIKADFGA